MGSTNNSSTTRLPGNSLRARAYDAGTPTSSDTATTMTATSRGTSSTEERPKSRQASEYQWNVKPSGSQVPNHRAPKESTTTEATSASRLRKKKPTTAQTSTAHQRGLLRAPGSDGACASVAISP